MPNFKLAPMAFFIAMLTYVLLALPLLFLLINAYAPGPLPLVALFLIAIYAWVWLRFRPIRFIVRPYILEIVWPLKRRKIPRNGISNIVIMSRSELRQKIGWGMRIGAGGLWGGFGWLWTKHCGLIQMYISRTDQFVWIERTGERPLLVTPENPAAFAQALST